MRLAELAAGAERLDQAEADLADGRAELDDGRVEAEALATLRPRGGLPMVVEAA